jgi:hypothetical protein
MTITTIYTPELNDYVDLGPYDFIFESIGAEAFEVWAVDANLVRTYIPPADYTVIFNGNTPIYDGGSVTLTNAPPDGTVSLSLERNTPITQLVDFYPYGRFGANVIEFALDKLTMICQELDARKCNKVDQNTGDTQTVQVQATL